MNPAGHAESVLVTAAFICAAVLVSAPASAQEPAAAFDQVGARLRPGARVTVTIDDGRTVVGRVRSLSRSGITMEDGGATAIPAESIVSVGRPGSRSKALALGAVIGGGLGLALGVGISGWGNRGCRPGDSPASGRTCLDGHEGAAVMAGTALIFAGAGFLVAASMPPSPTEVLYRAPAIPGGAPIALAPIASRGRLGVSLRVAF
jgi:hypothetical protein